jgi:hypothetical protein
MREELGRNCIRVFTVVLTCLIATSCSEAPRDVNPLTSQSPTTILQKPSLAQTSSELSTTTLVTSTAEYLDLAASVAVPSSVTTGEPFDIVVSGEIVGGGSFDVYSYGVYQDALWTYSTSHITQVSSGEVIDIDGFNFGNSYGATYEVVISQPGTHTFLFVLGQRSGGHGWYDLAIEATVMVTPGEPCDSSWRPPLGEMAKSGSTIPLKFSAQACDGTPYVDESTVVEVTNATGIVVAEWLVTGNPSTGVDVLDSGIYHVNWDTGDLSDGVYDVHVTFSTGAALSRTITLR